MPVTSDPTAVRCELWLRTPREAYPPRMAFTYQRIWIPADAGAGYLVTPHPPLLHDHVELNDAALLGAEYETVGTAPADLLVVGRSWRHFGRGVVLQLALSPVGALIRHDDAGADHLCVTAH